jgi:hypothetical protein
MKFTVNVDCTPEEARLFLGLPDVRPMQEALLRKVEQRMAAYLDATAAEALLKTWLPAGVHNIEQLQKMFWAAFQKADQRDK